jgi:hypothetical protein
VTLILDPTATDTFILQPIATDWLVLIVESAGAIGTLTGNVCMQATVQGFVESGPVWTGRLVIAPTFTGFVEL